MIRFGVEHIDDVSLMPSYSCSSVVRLLHTWSTQRFSVKTAQFICGATLAGVSNKRVICTLVPGSQVGHQDCFTRRGVSLGQIILQILTLFVVFFFNAAACGMQSDDSALLLPLSAWAAT